MKATSLAAGRKNRGRKKSTQVQAVNPKPASQPLAKSNVLYRNTLDSMLEGCQIIGHDWRYLYLNATAELQNRRPNQELLGNIYMEMWPGVEATQVFAEIKRCMEERVTVRLENRFVYPDGTVGWFNLRIQPIPEGILILSIDITAYKMTETQIIQLNRLYATLSQVNKMILRVRDQQDLFQSICDIAVQYGEVSLAWVGLLEENSGNVRPVVANGFDVNQWPFPIINIHQDEFREGLVATAIRTSQVTTSEDIQMDQRTRGSLAQVREYGYHSSAAIPLRSQGRTIGIVGVALEAAGVFKAEAEAHLLEEMGLNISFALETLETNAQRKVTEQALRESEERFSKAFYHSPIGMVLVDLTDLTIRDINHSLLELMNLEREQVVGQNSLLLGLEVEPEIRAAMVQELRERGLFRNKEVQIGLPNGEIRHVFYSGARVMIGERPHSLSLIQDLTELRQAEEKIAHQLRLLENVNDAVLVTDTQFNLTSWNQAAAEMYGYRAEEVLGRKAQEIIRSEFSDAHRDLAIQELSEHGFYRTEVVQHHRDGHSFWVEGSIFVLRESSGKIYGYVGINRNVTRRKQAEDQILRQLKHLNALRQIDAAISTSFDLDVVLDVVLHQVLSQLRVDASALLLFDAQLQTLEFAANQGFRSEALRYTRLKLGEGYASQAIQARKTIHISTLMEKGGKLVKALQDAKEEFADYYGTPLIVKGEIKGVLEIYHRSRLQATPEWLEFLEILSGQAAIAIDNAQLFENLQHSNANLERRVAERTTELNKTNAELERANRTKDEFLANMSHELRTPLTSILGLSESLLDQKRDPLTESQQKSLQVIASSGQHLLQLINDILDLSKIEAGKLDCYPQPVWVDEVCRSSLSFVREQAAKKSITLTYTNSAAISKILADPRRLKQILINLLNNAIKFTPEHGAVNLQVSADLEQDLIRFSVIDNGIGIAPEDLQRLFQPFVQVDSSLNRQHEGTGLGLALVQKLTDLHGGSIEVESEGEPGKGSRFSINLACNQNEIVRLERSESKAQLPVPEQAAFSESAPAGVPPQLVLLAEDNMANILTIEEYLKQFGYEVAVAHDGIEAVEKANALRPDLILMDIQMPAMNGLEAIARLRANHQFTDTPIIALTALAMPGDRERSLLAGATEYMSKPASLKALRQSIKRLLQR